MISWGKTEGQKAVYIEVEVFSVRYRVGLIAMPTLRDWLPHWWERYFYIKSYIGADNCPCHQIRVFWFGIGYSKANTNDIIEETMLRR